MDFSEFKSDPKLDEILDNVSLNTPIDIFKLSEKFEYFWVNKCKNSSSVEFIELWSTIFKVLNEVERRNSGPVYNKYFVVPAPTGSGKTLTFRAYASELAIQDKNSGALILSRFNSEVNETVEQINKTVGREVAVAYYKGKNIKDRHQEDELDDYQVVVTTHQYFKLNHHDNAKYKDTYNKVMSFKGNTRSTIIVDESINLLDSYEINQKLITVLESKAHLLDRECDSKELGLEAKLLKYINNNFKNLFFNDIVKTKVRYVDDKLPALRNISLELNESIDKVKDLFKLDKFIEAIKDKKLDKIDLVSKTQKNELIKDAKTLIHLLDDSLYLYNNQKYISSSLEQPTVSTVLFDATANVDKYYDKLDYVTVVQPLPEVKRYDNVKLNYVELDIGLGGNNIDKNLESHFNNLTLLYRNIDTKNFEDPIVVFTKKRLREYCEKQEIPSQIDHFGNLTGVNRYKDSNHILIYGINYKPDSLHYNNLYQSLGDEVFNTDAGGLISELAYTNISSEIIQAINRGRCRKVVDGQAPETNIYLTLAKRDTELNKRILSDIKQAMPGISVNTWDIDLSKIKGKDKERINPKFNNLLQDIKECTDNQVKLSKLPGYLSLSEREKRTAAAHLKDKNHPLSIKTQKYGYKYMKKGQHYLVRN